MSRPSFSTLPPGAAFLKPTYANGAAISSTQDKLKALGEGIGLLIVRHHCKMMDALIQVKTASGEGTTFRIIFPRALAAGSPHP